MPLVIDVETIGLPARRWGRCAPYTDLWAYRDARAVQISWALLTPRLQVRRTVDKLVRPRGFVIPATSTAIHGIDHARAVNDGVAIEEILQLLQEDLAAPEADCLVAHNADFDRSVLLSEAFRAGHPVLQTLLRKPVVCTMLSTVDYCKLPFATPRRGSTGYKYPRQEELYTLVLGRPMQHAHDALQDVLNLVSIMQGLGPQFFDLGPEEGDGPENGDGPEDRKEDGPEDKTHACTSSTVTSCEPVGPAVSFSSSPSSSSSSPSSSPSSSSISSKKVST